MMVYVWNAISVGAAEFYAMSWQQAVAIGDALEWTRTASWIDGGYYTSTKTSARLGCAGRRARAHRLNDP
jgi:hypothetical protein